MVFGLLGYILYSDSQYLGPVNGTTTNEDYTAIITTPYSSDNYC